VGSGSINTDWHPFFGNIPITKGKFFEIAGYNDEAERYNAAMGKNRKLTSGNGQLSFVGS
jgi:hypothetical protein